jgi:hypothetical protein
VDGRGPVSVHVRAVAVHVRVVAVRVRCARRFELKGRFWVHRFRTGSNEPARSRCATTSRQNVMVRSGILSGVARSDPLVRFLLADLDELAGLVGLREAVGEGECPADPEMPAGSYGDDLTGVQSAGPPSGFSRSPGEPAEFTCRSRVHTPDNQGKCRGRRLRQRVDNQRQRPPRWLRRPGRTTRS